MTFQIKLTSTEQAQKINRIVEKYSYNIWVHGKNGQADAKSMLGLMLMTIEDDIRIVVEDGIDTRALEKDIAEFRV